MHENATSKPPTNTDIINDQTSKTAELTVIGNPTLYPFDKYLVLAQASFEVWASSNESPFVQLNTSTRTVTSRVPGFNLRGPTENELQPDYWHSHLKSQQRKKRSRDQEWINALRKNSFGAVLERPRFLRELTITSESSRFLQWS